MTILQVISCVVGSFFLGTIITRGIWGNYSYFFPNLLILVLAMHGVLGAMSRDFSLRV